MPVFYRQHFPIGDIFLKPGRSEICRGATGAVAALGAVDREQKLAVREQLRDFIGALVAQALGDALVDRETFLLSGRLASITTRGYR
ncbi:hypothetical protein [Microbulbifer epialgicus]|uniref:hypothetical protein n=1 Tax=Microbulbifer epialgicus TaxID=393907 RepID=UPI003FA5CFC3